MPLHIENLDKGLVNSRDPSLLGDGELQQTDGALYRPNSQALHPIGYRVKRGVQQRDPATGLPYIISGLRRLVFDGSSTTLVADGAGLRWRYGPASNLTWTILPGVNARTVAAPIEAVQFANQYVLANGTDQQYVISEDLSVIEHGMTPLAGTGGHPIFSIPGVTNCHFSVNTTDSPVDQIWLDRPFENIHYFYWITEYDSVNDIESTYIGRHENQMLVVTTINDATSRIEIRIFYGTSDYPARVNPNATHWRIYRGWAPDVEGLSSDYPDSYDNWILSANPFPIGVRITNYDTADALTGVPLIDVPIPDEPAPVYRYDYGGDSVEPFPVIVITSEGVTGAITRDDPPSHRFSSGVIFEDSLVTNDTVNKHVIHYTPPILIHSQPESYTVAFDTPKRDVVTNLKMLGNKCIVGEKHSIWRVNYLPRGDDPIFDTTKVKDLISGDHGIVGPNAACVFSIPSDIPRLAFVAYDGIYSTDSLTIDPITTDIDWQAMVKVEDAAIEGSVLLNVEYLKSLWFFYVPVSATVGGIPTQATTRLSLLVFSYAPEHIKGRMLKVSGPIQISAASADYDPQDPRVFTGGYDGQTRTEDHQVLSVADLVHAELIDSAGMKIKTRFLHLGGLDGECAIERFHVLSGTTPQPERMTETLGYTKRMYGAPEEDMTWSKQFQHGTISRHEAHITAPGVAVKLGGFAPLHFVGLEHSSRKGN